MSLARVAMHVHSNWSHDAHLPLWVIAEAFRCRGYDAVLMAEHDKGFTARRWEQYQRACDEASVGVRLVPGIEYSDPNNVVHIPVWGTSMPFLGDGLETFDLLRAATASQAIAVLAHPWRRAAWSHVQNEWAPHLAGIEVWNRKYDGIAPNRQAIQLARRHRLRPLVSLDFHTRRQLFPLAMSVLISGPMNIQALLTSLASGQGEATVLGRPATRFSGGALGAVARSGEQTRRHLAPLLRRIG